MCEAIIYLSVGPKKKGRMIPTLAKTLESVLPRTEVVSKIRIRPRTQLF